MGTFLQRRAEKGDRAQGGEQLPPALGHAESKGSLVPKGVTATHLLTAIMFLTANLVKHMVLSVAVVCGGDRKAKGRPTPLNFFSIY